MNEEKNIYVQHKSGVGEKWRIAGGYYNDDSNRLDWRVIGGDEYHYLPKSEYIVCDPPEEWADVTHLGIIDNLTRTLKDVDGRIMMDWASGYRLMRVQAGLRLEKLCR